jgi:hypothetical protein
MLVAITGAASAAVLVEQLPQDQGLGYYANPNFPQQMADDFTLSGAASLDGITWWGGYDTANGGTEDQISDDFLVRLYSSVSGTGIVMQAFPSVAFTRTLTSLTDVAGNSVYQFDFDLSATPLALSAGTYSLFVQNLGASDWFWQAGASGNGTIYYRGEDTDSWQSFSTENLAFRLNGTPSQIPEPGILGLLMLAGVGLALARRRNPG